MSLIRDGILKNRWLWFHMFAGAFIAKLLQFFGLSDKSILSIIFFGAILWEILELFTTDIDKVYGNHRRFFLDSVCDVFGALIMALIVIF